MKRLPIVRHWRWLVLRFRMELAIENGHRPRLSDYIFLQNVWDGRE